jgi:iron(III) transport system substrate-binding protein
MTLVQTRRTARGAGLLLAAGILIAGCGSDSSSDEAAPAAAAEGCPGEEQALYEAAKDEPTLTWYTQHVQASNDAAVAGFKELYPDLDVTVQRLAGADLTTRYSAERTAGTVPASLVVASTTDFLNSGREEGWFETELDLPALEDWPEDAYADGAAKVNITPYFLGYNTDQIDEADAPESWEDLLDPRFSGGGQLSIGDPRTISGYLAMLYMLREEFGDEYLTGLKDQGLTVFASSVPGNQALASGAVSVMIPDVPIVANPLIEQGAPIALVPVSPTTGSENQVVVSTDAPSPCSARLLMNFLMTEDGQKAFNGAEGASVLEDLEGTLPLPEGYITSPEAEANAVKDELVELVGLTP